MQSVPSPTIWGNHRLDWGQHTYVMGIVNVTPDSFSGDGLVDASRSQDEIIHRAVTQAQNYVVEGAAMIDVGGESTRPHATAISVQQELARVLPVIQALQATLPHEVILSIDTYKAEVADRAIETARCPGSRSRYGSGGR